VFVDVISVIAVLYIINLLISIKMAPKKLEKKLRKEEKVKKAITIFLVSSQHLAQPQAGRPPFVGCPRQLNHYILSYPPYWRPFLHP
jgi:hypothetical protein